MGLARKKFTEFKERSDRIADAELDEFWATLQPATIDGMIGEWKGGEFVTGHKMNGQLEKAGWFGKTFKSAGDVQPLVCVDADGNKFSNIAMGKGEASLWLEDDDAVMGIMNGKGVLDNGRYYYFYLERL
jgi:hypothetical protein